MCVPRLMDLTTKTALNADYALKSSQGATLALLLDQVQERDSVTDAKRPMITVPLTKRAS